jgi:ADP-heptose:LPS heptosyltransferase
MSTFLSKLNWRYWRWRLEVRRRSPGILKFQNKVINVFRRIGIWSASFYLKRFHKDGSLSLDEISSILIVPSWPIGDLLLNLPLLRTLKSRKPNIRIGLAISPKNVSMVKNNPDVDVMYDLHSLSPRVAIREMKRAKKDGWDVVISTAAFFRPFRTALRLRYLAGKSPTATLTMRKLARYQRLYSYCYLRPGDPWPPDTREHFLLLVELLFGIVATDDERQLRFTPDVTAQRSVDERLNVLLSAVGATRIIHINLEAKAKGLEWGIANSIALANRVCELYPDVLVVLTASPNFAEAFHEVLEIHEQRVKYFQTGSIHELAALVQRVELVITPDTSVMHFAVAADKPVVAFFDSPNEWLPYPRAIRHEKARILYSGQGIPVRSIPVVDVLSAAKELMAVEIETVVST